MDRPSLRHRLSQALDPEMRDRQGLSPLNRLVMAAICASVLTGVLETEPAVVAAAPMAFRLAHLGFALAFLAEYAARLYAAPLNPRFGSSWRYARTPASVLDLLVVASFLLPYLGLEAALLRLLRAGRLLRLARLGRYSRAMQLIGDAVAARRHELGLSLAVAASLLILSSTALYFAERAAQPEAFGSIPRAMWWSVATLTTVGYGDVVPVTALGRVFSALTAITGIGIIAIPTGILAGAFAEAIRKARED